MCAFKQGGAGLNIAQLKNLVLQLMWITIVVIRVQFPSKGGVVVIFYRVESNQHGGHRRVKFVTNLIDRVHITHKHLKYQISINTLYICTIYLYESKLLINILINAI